MTEKCGINGCTSILENGEKMCSSHRFALERCTQQLELGYYLFQKYGITNIKEFEEFFVRRVKI